MKLRFLPRLIRLTPKKIAITTCLLLFTIGCWKLLLRDSWDKRPLKMGQNLHNLAAKNRLTKATWTEWRRDGLHITGASNEKNLSLLEEITREAWKSYVALCALKTGGNELAPLTKSCSSESDNLVGPNNLLTVIDALDTLIIMGLNEEFKQGRDLIERMFNPLATSTPVSVFETTIRILGGLLGAFSLTEDQLFAHLAIQVGNGLADAFSDGRFSPTVMLTNASLDSHKVTPKSNSSIVTNIAEVGSLYLEFAYLSEVSGDPKFHQWVDRNQRSLLNISNLDGLLPIHVVSKSAWKLEPLRRAYSVGGMADSYYEYLVKRCLFDEPDEAGNCVSIYSKSLDGIMKHLAWKSSADYLLIVNINSDGNKEHKMQHLACFAGGMFALAYMENKVRRDWLEFAKQVTETCYLSYFNHPLGLGSEVFEIDEKTNKIVPFNVSVSVMYAVTGNQIYKDWGWNIIKALNSTAVRTSNGFSGIKFMKDSVPVLDNNQQSFFLAETLKYLYLLFLPPEALPLDQWLFNTEAHVIPHWRNQLRRRLGTMSMG